MVSVSTRDRLNLTLPLADGRTLGYAEFGDPNGKPLMFFHGGGGSRLLGELCHKAALRQGVRVIAPDRPGMGLSDPQPGRRLLDWPQDVVQLADSLGLQKLATMGHSAGAVYALACAKAFPDRLSATIVIGCFARGAATSGMPLMFRLMLLSPGFAARSFAQAMSELVRDPIKSACKSAAWLSAADQRAFADPEFARIVHEGTREALRRGTSGVVQDVRLIFSRWGFELSEVRGRIDLWHGEDDRMAPVAFGRYAAARLPDCVATFCADEGHNSILVNRMEEILAIPN
jgi:pimeloyl-ACP methyl ester carboxylesterase